MSFMCGVIVTIYRNELRNELHVNLKVLDPGSFVFCDFTVVTVAMVTEEYRLDSCGTFIQTVF